MRHSFASSFRFTHAPSLGSSQLVNLLLCLTLATAAAQAEPRSFELAVRDGALPESQRVIVVTQGDDVTLRWSSDQALRVHLHGYDVEISLHPGAVSTMQVAANATGRFPIEVHASEGHREWTLAYLEVHPR
jgi:hypothetical protein